MSRGHTAGGTTSPSSWHEVRAFLQVELELNDEWQAALTIRLWRTGQWLYRTRTTTPRHALAWKVWVLCERIWFHAVLGADIPPGVEAGLGLRFAHAGRNVILHPRVRFGPRCTVYHSVTVGLRGRSDDVPVFGGDVTLGAGCVVLGGVEVGDGAAIGPNAVIVENVAAGVHMVSEPPRALPGRLSVTDRRATASGRVIPLTPPTP